MANKVSVDLDLNVSGYKQGLDQATQSTAAYETETKKIKDSLVSLSKELKNSRTQANNLALAYSKLDKEAKQSTFGKEMKQQLDEAVASTSQLKDLTMDLNETYKNLGSDTFVFDSLSQGVGVAMNATAAFSGIMAQFTGDEKAAQQAVVMFTTAQSTLNTITGISNALQKQSSLMLGINKVQTLAAAAATKMKTAAETRGVVATKAATAAQKAFNVVASANPYVLLATAILAVGSALFAFASWMTDATEKEEAAKKAAEELKEAFEKERTTLANAAESFMQTAYKVQFLKEEYEKTTDALEKTEILKEATEEFKKMGLSINSVSDAQKALVQDGDKLIELLRLQGEAAALAAIKMELFKDKFIEIMKSNNYNVQQAYQLTSNLLEDELDGISRKELDLRKKISGIQKQVGIKDKTYGSGSKNKNKKDYDDGSLEYYKKQLSAKQDKLRKKKLSLVDVEKEKKRIKELTDIIENKEVELGFKEQDPKKIQGTEAWWKEEINKLEKMKAQLPIDAYIDRDKLQKQIDNMNLKVKLETEGVTITGSEARADVWADKTKKTIKDLDTAISAFNEKLETTVWDTMVAVTDERGRTTKTFDEYIQKLKELQAERTKLQDALSESMMNKGSLEWLSFKKNKYEVKLQASVVGSPEWKDALENINKLTKEEQKIKFAIEMSSLSSLEKVMRSLEGFHAIDNIVGSFENLSRAIEENANAWEIFMSVLSTFETIMAAVNTVTEIHKMLTEGTTNAKVAEAGATAAATTANEAQSASEAASEGTSSAALATNKALSASYLELASAMIFAAHASIPFAGVGVASGLVNTMLALQAAAKATAMSISAFANGGIVPGSSYSGDRVLARLNSGELVLNKRQQANLFNMLDNGLMPQKGGTNVQVTGVIRGTDIMLVQKNTNKVLSKTGSKITF